MTSVAAGLEQRGAADLGPELPIAQDQQDGHDGVEGPPEVFAEAFGRGVAARGDDRAMFSTAARTMLPSNSSHAMRLRAVSAAASKPSTNDQAKLVSGKLNR